MNKSKLKVRIVLNILLGLIAIVAGILFLSNNLMTGILLFIVSALWITSAILNYIRFKKEL